MTDRATGEETRRRRRARTPAGIPFATVERLIAELHGIPPEELVALRARLHSLRRLNFPNGVAAGSGRHFAYAAADVIAIAVAFELVEAFIPPAAAVDIVRAGWPEIARTALGAQRSDDPTAVVTVHPRALRRRPDQTGFAPPHHVEVAALSGAPDRKRTIAIDVGALVKRAIELLKQLDRRSHTHMLDGMADIERRFGPGRALDRSASPGSRLGADGPFWDRATWLLGAVARGFGDDDARALRWIMDYAVRPAPIDRWKTRVEVDDRIGDVGFGAALTWVCAGSGIRPARTALPADDLQRVGRTLLSVLGTRDGVIERLSEIARRAGGMSGEVISTTLRKR